MTAAATAPPIAWVRWRAPVDRVRHDL